MSKISDNSGGPLWPTSLPDEKQETEKAKSEFEKAIEKAQRGAEINPLANKPPVDLEAADSDEDDPMRRVQETSETSADTNGGDGENHQQDREETDPYADIPWQIREQLGL